jgi:hypothetical protein
METNNAKIIGTDSRVPFRTWVRQHPIVTYIGSSSVGTFP